MFNYGYNVTICFKLLLSWLFCHDKFSLELWDRINPSSLMLLLSECFIMTTEKENKTCSLHKHRKNSCFSSSVPDGSLQWLRPQTETCVLSGHTQFKPESEWTAPWAMICSRGYASPSSFEICVIQFSIKLGSWKLSIHSTPDTSRNSKKQCHFNGGIGLGNELWTQTQQADLVCHISIPPRNTYIC